VQILHINRQQSRRALTWASKPSKGLKETEVSENSHDSGEYSTKSGDSGRFV
jgi:hypothetical protein